MSNQTNPTQDKKVVQALRTISDERKQNLLMNLLSKGEDVKAKKFVDALVPRTKEEAILKAIPVYVEAPEVPAVKTKTVPIGNGTIIGTTGKPMNAAKIVMSGTGSLKEAVDTFDDRNYTKSSPALYVCKFDKIANLISMTPQASDAKSAVYVVPVIPGTSFGFNVSENVNLYDFRYGYVNNSTVAPTAWVDQPILAMSTELYETSNINTTVPDNVTHAVIHVYRGSSTDTADSIKSNTSSVFIKNIKREYTGKFITTLKNSNGITTSTAKLVTSVAPSKSSAGVNHIKVEDNKLKFVQEVSVIARDPASTPWATVTTTGTVKMWLEYAQGVAYKDNIYLIGGKTDGGNIMVVYNTTTNTFTTRNIGIAVVGCAATVVDNYLYIFGGHYGSNGLSLTLAQCTKSGKVYRINLDNQNGVAEPLADIPSLGSTPFKFFGASSIYWKSKICIIVCPDYAECGNDWDAEGAMQCFDPATLTWQRNAVSRCWAHYIKPALAVQGDMLAIATFSDLSANRALVTVNCPGSNILLSSATSSVVSNVSNNQRFYTSLVVDGKIIMGSVSAGSPWHKFYEVKADGTVVDDTTEIAQLTKTSNAGSGVMVAVNGVTYNIYSGGTSAETDGAIKVVKLKTGGTAKLTTPIVTEVSNNIAILNTNKYFTSLSVENDTLEIEGDVEVYDI